MAFETVESAMLEKRAMRWLKFRQRYYALIESGKEGLEDSLIECDAAIDDIRDELVARAAAGDTVAEAFVVTLDQLLALLPDAA